MPRRDDLSTILVIGSGPIVIGQGCEFDYSGAQACKALRDEGYRVVLVNSNPATIMTDPAFADRTYIEPITPEAVTKIIEAERDLGRPIDAVLPTLGGQTALNCACALYDDGVFDEFQIEMIGADRRVIHRAEDRSAFRDVCESIGVAMPESKTVTNLPEAHAFLEQIGLPAIIRPAFTLGGWGGGVAHNRQEFDELVQRGCRASMIGQVQIDRSLLGWKEYELEVVRDKKDNCVIVCGIENIDPMGVHTGDSVTVAPILTLTDKEYQALRDAAIAIMREVGVETGGSNVQFAVNPRPSNDHKFEFVCVEMNPRVSRSSALASKATGFPIAKIAARLAVGYTLDELRNDITRTTSACFEPAIDYVVTKMPRWTFEKFPEANETLTTQMKSVGEAMAIGRTFKESFQKCVRSMDVKRFGLGLDRNDKWLAYERAMLREQGAGDRPVNVPRVAPPTDDTTSDPVAGRVSLGARTADGQPIEWPIDEEKLHRKLGVPSQGRLYYVRYALKMGYTVDHISELSGIDPFFIDQIAELVEFEDTLCRYERLEDVPREVMFEAKRLGYADAQLACLYLGTISSETILEARAFRESLGVKPVYKQVDTCAAEFEAVTPYYYSTYQRGHLSLNDAGETVEIEPEDEIRAHPDREKVIILGGGPNRIGQGIEFDYCCVHAAFAANELGFESVMINSNPETVSTDYDTSDLLFFEPLTLEDTLNVIERLNEVSDGATERQSDEGSSTQPSSGSSPLSLRRSVAPSLDRPIGPVKGVIVQFGGQTPLNLSGGLDLAGVPILGTPLDAIDRAEDRERFDELLTTLDLKRPAGAIAHSLDEARERAKAIGYPVLVRPSYVLGGRGMEICYDEKSLVHYMTSALDISDLEGAPVLIDQFLDGAIEVDVDVVADYGNTTTDGPNARMPDADGRTPQALVCGVMEHIEHAGVHSGDSTCTVPPSTLHHRVVDRIRDTARRIAEELGVCGLMNVQAAIKDDEIYIIEVNPRASRTVPFVGKAKQVAWASVAAKAMMGRSLADQEAAERPDVGFFAIKAPVFPFQKFPGVDFVLGPEMRSTGEVMGVDISLPTAYLKAQLAAGVTLPREGGVFISVRRADRNDVVDAARSLMAMGFEVYCTDGTGEALARHGLRPRLLQKIAAGVRPNVIDLMTDGRIALVINTPTRTGWKTDEGAIRATAVRLGITMLTTISATNAAVRAIEANRAGVWTVRALQDLDALAAESPAVTNS
ncbi:MAG: carbamoyl phosphate synthase large subunit [Phycisphaerae bacterium]|nr:carbamoyl phosphate synthase large subunit [Phycisphaerae bacterium]